MAAAPSRVDGKGGCLHEQSESMRVESKGLHRAAKCIWVYGWSVFGKKNTGSGGRAVQCKEGGDPSYTALQCGAVWADYDSQLMAHAGWGTALS